MDLSSESTEDLVQRFAREIALYWELDESLTYAETKCSKDRKDFAQLGVCDAVLNEIESRGKDEMLKLKALLDHPIPGVRLVAAFHLEDLIPEQLEDVYRELMSRPRRANGLPDTYAARAGASLDRILGITKPFY